ncbi:MAG: hypothetical protein Q8R79_06495 [Legionellaceae bacterium]|nr:hypothetical protein [Legionellaceae bacterium]
MTKKYVILNAAESISSKKGFFIVKLYSFILWAFRTKFKDSPIIHIYDPNKVKFTTDEIIHIQNADKIIIVGHGQGFISTHVETSDKVTTSVAKISHMLSGAFTEITNKQINISLCVCNSINVAIALTGKLASILNTQNSDKQLSIKVTGRNSIVVPCPFNGKKYNLSNDNCFPLSHQKGDYKSTFFTASGSNRVINRFPDESEEGWPLSIFASD